MSLVLAPPIYGFGFVASDFGSIPHREVIYATDSLCRS